jgi:hypothetical protein
MNTSMVHGSFSPVPKGPKTMRTVNFQEMIEYRFAEIAAGSGPTRSDLSGEVAGFQRLDQSKDKEFVSDNTITPISNPSKFFSGPWGDSPSHSPGLANSRVTNQNLTDSGVDSASFKVEQKLMAAKPIIPSLKIFPKSFEIATRDGRDGPLILESLYESPSVDVPNPNPNPNPNPYLLMGKSPNRQHSFGPQNSPNQPGDITFKSRVSHKRNATEDMIISPRTPALERQHTDTTLEEPEYF